jgi:glycerate kinase
MKILIAPDKFKGTLSALQAAQAIARGIRRACPAAQLTLCPLTDGGEGFVEILVRASGGKLFRAQTLNALSQPCVAKWGELGDGCTAVIGLTEASGLAQIPPSQRTPLYTTNLGTGQLIQRAVKKGYQNILIGLGGSATTEGGISLVAPLGFQFLDRYNEPIPLTGAGLKKLVRILPPKKLLHSDLRPPHFVVATDVTNPLYGTLGAAHQFAKQKGATPRQILQLEANLRHLAAIVKRDLGRNPHRAPGAGAAGGCGYGLMAFLQAEPQSGFAIASQFLGLEKLVASHDLIITGEGCLDATSLRGKAPSELARMALAHHKPIYALAGKVARPEKRLPFTRALGIVSSSVTSTQAMQQPSRYLEQTAYHLLKTTLS